MLLVITAPIPFLLAESSSSQNPKGGKGAADRMAATCKNHIRIYLNEGHDVKTAEQMRDALLSHGGVEGVRVAVLQSLNETTELQKIPGISKLNNFQYTDGNLQALRAYGIGQGKNIMNNTW